MCNIEKFNNMNVGSFMEEICYKKNYLSEVVTRIDFAAPIGALLSEVIPTDIHAAIKKHYSIYEPGKITEHGVHITDESVVSNKKEIQQWVYHGEDRDKTIIVSAYSFIVTFKAYKDYGDFKENIIEPLQKIIELERNVQIKRTGLRFVNIFSGFIQSFGEVINYFHPMISSSFSDLVDQGNCSRNFLITEYIYDEIKLRMQSGIYNPDYPARIKKFDFIVDLDAYIDTPHITGNVESLIDDVHYKIQEKFEACITDKLRGALNGQ